LSRVEVGEGADLRLALLDARQERRRHFCSAKLALRHAVAKIDGGQRGDVVAPHGHDLSARRSD
jgi:hypothetical protein